MGYALQHPDKRIERARSAREILVYIYIYIRVPGAGFGVENSSILGRDVPSKFRLEIRCLSRSLPGRFGSDFGYPNVF